jgi:hypothetical protein
MIHGSDLLMWLQGLTPEQLQGVVVVPGHDHSFREATLACDTALLSSNKRHMSEDYGDEPDTTRVPVIIVS